MALSTSLLITFTFFGCSRSFSRLTQEPLDDFRRLICPIDEEEVPAALHHVEPGIGYAAREHAAVGQPDDRVVITGHHQRRLANLSEKAQARPADGRHHLHVVPPEPRRPVQPGRGLLVGERRPTSAATVEERSNQVHVAPRVVAVWCQQYRQGKGITGHGAQPAGGGSQDEPSNALRGLERKLLSNGPAQGDPEDVNASVPQLVNQSFRNGG